MDSWIKKSRPGSAKQAKRYREAAHKGSQSPLHLPLYEAESLQSYSLDRSALWMRDLDTKPKACQTDGELSLACPPFHTWHALARPYHKPRAFSADITATELQCPTCSCRLCASRLGLQSHQRIHGWSHNTQSTTDSLLRTRWTTTKQARLKEEFFRKLRHILWSALLSLAKENKYCDLSRTTM